MGETSEGARSKLYGWLAVRPARAVKGPDIMRYEPHRGRHVASTSARAAGERARRIVLLAAIATLALVLPPPVIPAEPLEAGFTTIFDGQSLKGWETPDRSYWSVEEGAITGRITLEHPCNTNQYLVWTGGELADFELKLKSRLNGEGAINNGFQFRSRLLPDHDVACYQMDNNLKTDWLVRLYDEFGRHTLAFRGQRTVFDVMGQPRTSPIPEAAGPAPFRLEDWHEYHLVCEGTHLTLKVNGLLMAEVNDLDPKRHDLAGILALQLHSGPPTLVQFKDIRLKVLKPAPRVPERIGPAAYAPGRRRLLEGAAAFWDLGVGGHGAAHPLRQAGNVEFNVRPDGPGSAPAGRVAHLAEGYFDAGKDLNVAGDRLTVYLRAREPRGDWTHALFAKRGRHEIINFNLFSVDLPGTPGPDIGFEVHTESGFVMVSFPVSRIDPLAWHDLAGRYDGRSVELICDGQVMASRAWAGGKLTLNQEPLLIGAETDNGKVVRQFSGEIETAAVWSRALSDADLARLMGAKRIIPGPAAAPRYESPVHYRPKQGRLADTIPFYWQGQYHIFYLRAIDKVPWEHIVSKDLVHWREAPTALVADGAPDGPDGQNMFTGSVIERDGLFHIFYTGWNPRNPAGLEFVMHATSPDLMKWTKVPADIFGPDGVLYANQRQRDFRDPYVFHDAAEQKYRMFLCTGSKTGVAVSSDLRQWELRPPLEADYTGLGTPECPDYFSIGDTHYLICSPTGTSSTYARHAPKWTGRYLDPVSPAIDTPILYAAKRMFDGRRHVLTGWIRDLAGDRDGGGFEWGGDQSVPREVYAGPGGQLLFRPVPEAAAVFKRVGLDLAKRPGLLGAAPGWRYDGSKLLGEGGAGGAAVTFDAPDNYYLECRCSLGPEAVLILGIREPEAPGSGYRLVVRPAQQEAEIAGATFRYPRRIILDPARPLSVRAFVQGSIIECFLNDAFAFSCRAYDHRTGRLSLGVTGGKVEVQELRLKTN